MINLNADPTQTRRNRHRNLERRAIGFTVGLYLFISGALLAFHYSAPLLPLGGDCDTSSTSPFNPC